MERNNMISVSKYDGGTINTYTMNIDELHEIIDRKAYEFAKRYSVRPKYIKIPEWVYKGLKRFEPEFAARPVGNGFMNQPETLFGYIVCPTVSIESTDNIEVF